MYYFQAYVQLKKKDLKHKIYFTWRCAQTDGRTLPNNLSPSFAFDKNNFQAEQNNKKFKRNYCRKCHVRTINVSDQKKQLLTKCHQWHVLIDVGSRFYIKTGVKLSTINLFGIGEVEHIIHLHSINKIHDLFSLNLDPGSIYGKLHTRIYSSVYT